MRTSRVIATFVLALLPGMATSADCIALSTDKSDYLVYEPVTLTMEYFPQRAPEHFHFGTLEDMSTTMVLEIQAPEASYNYDPPISTERFPSPGVTVEYAQLILQKGEVITGRPGSYTLRIRDPRSRQYVSPAVHFSVQPPSDPGDVDAHSIIRRNPAAYGLFLYLEGGDHIEPGHEIFKQLGATDSRYRPMARAVLAMNYSQASFDMAKNKLRRAADPAMVEELFPSEQDGSSPYLRMRAARMVRQQLGKDKLSPVLSRKVEAVRQAAAGRDVRSRLGRELAQ